MLVGLLDDLSLHLFCLYLFMGQPMPAFRYISFNVGIIVRVSLFVCQSGISVYFSSISMYFIVFPCICLSTYFLASRRLSVLLFKPKMNDRMNDEILRCWEACCLLPPATIVKYKSYGNWLLPIGQLCRRRPKTGKSIRTTNVSFLFIYLLLGGGDSQRQAFGRYKKQMEAGNLGKMMLRQSSRRQQKRGVADPMQMDPEEASRIPQLSEMTNDGPEMNPSNLWQIIRPRHPAQPSVLFFKEE